MTKKETNLLDSVKEHDRIVRTKIVYNKLEDMEEWAKTILRLKRKTELLLQELKVDDADIKRIIDHVNSQAGLTEADIEKLREEVRGIIKTAKKDPDTVTWRYSSDGSSSLGYTLDSSAYTTGTAYRLTTTASTDVNTKDLQFNVK